MIFSYVQKLELVSELTHSIAARLTAELVLQLRPHPLVSHQGRGNTDKKENKIKEEEEEESEEKQKRNLKKKEQ